ncbi:MAG: hypothetical protein DRQ44_05810 [Gammaproteobacteria bacterium]|nr:MAG: hypothetical protein DRQ44_05810 [Gammaproteobacteria bacterium]
MKKLIILASVLALGACAKNVPPPQAIIIPVQLVNMENTQVVAVDETPGVIELIRIKPSDRADEALETVLRYTSELKEHDDAVTTQLGVSTNENLAMRARLKKIKQYILLNQANQSVK